MPFLFPSCPLETGLEVFYPQRMLPGWALMGSKRRPAGFIRQGRSSEEQKNAHCLWGPESHRHRARNRSFRLFFSAQS